MNNDIFREKRKVLPVTKPLIAVYTQDAHLLSVLSCYEETYPWIISNYINIYRSRETGWTDFYFPYHEELRPSEKCAWVTTQKIHRNTVNPIWGSIIDFVIYQIDNDNYVQTKINYFYIPLSYRYKKFDLHHDILIYGYDKSTSLFYVADFFARGKYTTGKITFNELSEAFAGYDKCENIDYLKQMIFMYKFNMYSKYIFDVNNIINATKCYLSCDPPEYWTLFNANQCKEFVFGNEVYKLLIENLNNVGINDEKLDLIPFWLIYEHKRLLRMRYNYLFKNKYICCNDSDLLMLRELEDDSLKVVNLLIKYIITNKVELVNKSANILDKINIKESTFLEKLLLML